MNIYIHDTYSYLHIQTLDHDVQQVMRNIKSIAVQRKGEVHKSPVLYHNTQINLNKRKLGEP